MIHLWRQIGLRLGDSVRDVDLIDVRRCVDVEGDRQRHRAVVGVARLHVEHVVHAVHLLLERRGDGLFHRDRVRSGILRGDQDLRRHDLRELRDRQPAHRHETAEDGDDGDDDRDDGPADEEAGHARLYSIAGAGCGATRVPSRSDGASITTRSFACSPFSTIQRLPERPPSETVLIAILLSGVRTRS